MSKNSSMLSTDDCCFLFFYGMVHLYACLYQIRVYTCLHMYRFMKLFYRLFVFLHALARYNLCACIYGYTHYLYIYMCVYMSIKIHIQIIHVYACTICMSIKIHIQIIHAYACTSMYIYMHIDICINTLKDI